MTLPRAVGAVGLLVLWVALPLALRPGRLRAQGYQGEIYLGGSVLELRPLTTDSLPEREVPGTGVRRRLADGTIATCTPNEYCRWFRSTASKAISVLTQELRLTAWFGIRGLGAHARLRGRYGSDDFWPRSTQEFEAVTAYLSYDRSRYRVRAGRQIRSDGLGYYNFDGLSILWRAPAGVRLEGYGGWSLARGVNAPRTGSLVEEAEELPPDDRGYILGVRLAGRAGRTVSASATYQREIRTDRLALYSERLALDAVAFLGPVTLGLSSRYDVALAEFNKARFRVSAPLPAGLQIAAEVRHYSPFFELWTIWGAFAPVGFNEGRGSLAWEVGRTGLSLEAGGAYRDYGQTHAGTDFLPIRGTGWRAFGAAAWRRRGWFTRAGYRAEIGFGAARLGGDAVLGRTLISGTYVALRGSSTQTFGEFRLGERRASGAGLEVGLELGDLALTGSAALYRLTFANRPQDSGWTQGRFSAGLRYRFGTEIRARGPVGRQGLR